MISKAKILGKKKGQYFVQGFIKYLDQGWQTYSVKSHNGRYAQPGSATTQFCHWENTAIKST